MVGRPELLAFAESDDGISTVSEEPSLDLDAAMAGINGIHPDLAVGRGSRNRFNHQEK